MEFTLNIVYAFHRGFRRLFTSGVYTETWEDIADGGPTCYNELSMEYRAATCIINVFILYLSNPKGMHHICHPTLPIGKNE
jgi:hypothetical protein